jgi:putative acetyltransferase
MKIRPEEEADRRAVQAINEVAFGGPAEADLVERLRAAGELVLSLVAIDDKPVGHVAFSRLALPGLQARGSALAPLAVLPSHRRRGIGAALVKEALRRLAAAEEDFVLVLGDPAYYGRFGFSADAARSVSTPYDGPHLQALAFSGGALPRGPVQYAKAFAELA